MPSVCKKIECFLAPDTAIYSLSTNLAFNGTAISFIVPCPEGFVCDSTWPRTVTYPPNRFVFPLPDPQGCSPLAPLRFQGCSSEIIVAIPLCSTAAQIAALGQQVIQLAGQQQAECDSLDPDGPFPPPQPETFTNIQTSIGCENENLQLAVTGGTLPPGITFAGGLLTAAAGIFGGPTQAIANFNATEFLESLRDDLIADGDAECFCVGNFTATPDADSIDLSWDAHPLADSYIVERATVSGGPYTQLINTSGTSYDDETAVIGTAYYYLITPRSIGVNLCESEEVSAAISGCECVPFEGNILTGLGFDNGWATYDSVSNRAFAMFTTDNVLSALDPTKTIAQNPFITDIDPVVSDAGQDIGPTGVIAAGGSLYVFTSYINVSRFMKITRLDPVTLGITGAWDTGGFPLDTTFSLVTQLAYDSVNQKIYFVANGLATGNVAVHVFNLNTTTFSLFDESPDQDGSQGTLEAYDPVTNRIYVVKIFSVPTAPASELHIRGFNATTFTQESDFQLSGINDGNIGTLLQSHRLYAFNGLLYHSGFTQGGVEGVGVFNTATNTFDRVINVVSGPLSFLTGVCNVMCVNGNDGSVSQIQLGPPDTLLCSTTDSGGSANSIAAAPGDGKIYAPVPFNGSVDIYATP